MKIRDFRNFPISNKTEDLFPKMIKKFQKVNGIKYLNNLSIIFHSIICIIIEIVYFNYFSRKTGLIGNLMSSQKKNLVKKINRILENTKMKSMTSLIHKRSIIISLKYAYLSDSKIIKEFLN